MTPRQIAALAVRVLALYCIIHSFEWLGQGLMFIAISPTRGSVWLNGISFIPFFAYVGFGTLLWILADGLTIYMAPREENAKAPHPVSTPDLGRIAFAVLGAWFGVDALSVLVRTVVDLVWNNQVGSGSFSWNPRNVSNLLYTCIELIASLWLLFGARGIVKLIVSAHNIGRDPNFHQTPPPE